jgi:hypothetical protein
MLIRMNKTLTKRRVWIARSIALAADALQLAVWPLFIGGAPEGLDAAVDAGVAIALCWLCGFHPAFLPAFVAEALPGVDLVPSWTLAVMIATRDTATKSLPQTTPGPTA